MFQPILIQPIVVIHRAMSIHLIFLILPIYGIQVILLWWMVQIMLIAATPLLCLIQQILPNKQIVTTQIIMQIQRGIPQIVIQMKLFLMIQISQTIAQLIWLTLLPMVLLQLIQMNRLIQQTIVQIYSQMIPLKLMTADIVINPIRAFYNFTTAVSILTS